MKSRNFIYLVISLLSSVVVMNSCVSDENGSGDQTEKVPSAVFNPNLTYGSMTDQDGNVYKTITIGTQTWMAENLRTTKFRNGDPIANETDDAKWVALTSSAYCIYNNDASFKSTYGLLYNWYAANDSRIIAPTGWHVPTGSDWSTLSDFLGHNSVAGFKLKESDTIHWAKIVKYGLTPSTNESGFTALPGGNRNNLSCSGMRQSGGWWIVGHTSSAGNIGYRYLEVGSDYFDSKNALYYLGLSIRCVKD